MCCMPNCLEYISRCPPLPLLYYIVITYCRYIQWNPDSFPGAEEGEERAHGTHCLRMRVIIAKTTW